MISVLEPIVTLFVDFVFLPMSVFTQVVSLLIQLYMFIPPAMGFLILFALVIFLIRLLPL